MNESRSSSQRTGVTHILVWLVFFFLTPAVGFLFHGPRATLSRLYRASLSLGHDPSLDAPPGGLGGIWGLLGIIGGATMDFTCQLRYLISKIQWGALRQIAENTTVQHITAPQMQDQPGQHQGKTCGNKQKSRGGSICKL